MSHSFDIVGLISDTHGLMRPEALDALRDSDLIIHCGDIGQPAVLEKLQSVAPVHAVRGNNDRGGWAVSLPTSDIVEVGEQVLYVLHNLSDLSIDLANSHVAAIISGHSHKPGIQRRGKILFVNPGSAGPRRFALPVTVATLVVRSDHCEAKIVELVK
jgi:uncharacterized protein